MRSRPALTVALTPLTGASEVCRDQVAAAVRSKYRSISLRRSR
jgi:hypothetical protein